MSVSDIQRRLSTLDEVAERLGQSRRTIERKVETGELPALQLGGPRTAIRVDVVELRAWLYGEPDDPASAAGTVVPGAVEPLPHAGDEPPEPA
jgi:excisionase family DNA binding protein